MRNLPFRKKSNASMMLCMIMAIGLLSSCRSYKDLRVLKDVTSQESLKDKPVAPPVYTIKPLDNLFITVVSSNKEMNVLFNPALSSATGSQNLMYQEIPVQYLYGYEVSVEGVVTIPQFGKMSVLGMTLKECETAIYEKAGEYLKDVTVKVRLLNYKVTVMGEVTKPGVYYNYNYNFTVMDAISMASGITDYADLESVVVVRPTANGSQTYTMNLNSKDALASSAYYLIPNDIVIVQPARYKNIKLRTPAYTIVLSTAATILLFLNFLK